MERRFGIGRRNPEFYITPLERAKTKAARERARLDSDELSDYLISYTLLASDIIDGYIDGITVESLQARGARIRAGLTIQDVRNVKNFAVMGSDLNSVESKAQVSKLSEDLQSVITFRSGLQRFSLFRPRKNRPRRQ
jgi:hypothetical protein